MATRISNTPLLKARDLRALNYESLSSGNGRHIVRAERFDDYENNAEFLTHSTRTYHGGHYVEVDKLPLR